MSCLPNALPAMVQQLHGCHMTTTPRKGSPCSRSATGLRPLWRSYTAELLSTWISNVVVPISWMRSHIATASTDGRLGHVHDGHGPERTGQA